MMAALAIGSVGLWTLRVALAAARRKATAAVVAAVEALVFALVFANLISNLDSPGRLLGYALGVAVGTLAGLRVNDRMTIGNSEVRIAVDGRHAELIGLFHERGWPATGFAAEGPQGAVLLVFVALDDDRVAALIADIRELTPEAFVSVHRLRSVQASTLPQGFVGLRVARGRRSRFRGPLRRAAA